MDTRQCVLVIDDDDDIRRLYERVLSPHYDVDALASAEEAIALIDAGARYDAIVCDVMLPGLSGITFAALLAFAEADLASRVVFVTAAGPTVALPGPRLQKPFTIASLVQAVRDAADSGLAPLSRTHVVPPAFMALCPSIAPPASIAPRSSLSPQVSVAPRLSLVPDI
jgi:CheY-like chemotaxis protein